MELECCFIIDSLRGEDVEQRSAGGLEPLVTQVSSESAEPAVIDLLGNQ